MHGYETRSLITGEEHRLTVLQNRVHSNTRGIKSEEVTGDRRKITLFLTYYCYSLLLLLHVYLLLYKMLGNKFPGRRILSKQSVTRLQKTTEEAFSVWSAPCPALSSRTVKTSTIKDVFCVFRAESL